MALTEQQIQFFANFIKLELGIIYVPANYYQLEARLEQVAKILQIPTATELYLQANKGITGLFKQVLLDIATNNETSFFRDVKVFAAVEKDVLANLKKNNPKSVLFRIWCAASSFGQEPYSIAMLVDELMDKSPGHPPIQILATDIADRAIDRTKEAVYSQLEVQRGLSTTRLLKYFQKKEDNYWALRPDIRSKVSVQKLNLLDSFLHLGKFDVIFCRYVLIYQDQEKKKEIIQKLTQALQPGGILIMGASESLFGLSNDFEQITFDGMIYYKKKSGIP